MTQRQRIEELEAKVATLEARLAAVEARPVFYPYPYYVQSSPTVYPWQTTWTSKTTAAYNTFSGGV